MTRLQIILTAALLAAFVGVRTYAAVPLAAAPAPSAAGNAFLDLGRNAEGRLVPSSAQVETARSQDPNAPGFVVIIHPGVDNYPGVSLKPEKPAWDLSRFGHIQARVVNTGSQPLSVVLRVDNAGDWKDSPWNTESIDLEPGQSGTVTTLFGYAYGYKPGYPLNPSAVVNLVLFTGKSTSVHSFRVEAIQAGGTRGEAPAVSPDAVRIMPPHGSLLDTATRVTAQNAQATLTGQTSRRSLEAVFPASAAEQSVSLLPVAGRWDLRDYLGVRITIINEGATPAAPRVRLESNGGVSDWIPAALPLGPGKAAQIFVPFAGLLPVNLTKPAKENHLTSDAVAAVTLALGGSVSEGNLSERRLRVREVLAVLPQTPLPVWLGKRPPAAGDWVRTLDEEFSGSTLNSSLWSIYGDNYWDKQTHWSKSDVLLGGGVVRLRYEKKSGFPNDDPGQKPTAYAAGYLHTYDKWAQRYGYFEARMKLPTAPGLWPAFWMMPDRGAAAGPEQWKRQDTGSGGMEFDIMEHLTRWGPHRYNIAMHYDGYGKDHQQIGSDKIYVEPDKEGFITCGLLWTPGSAIYYCNGHEVLRWESPRVSSIPSILMFTLPTGGWDNSPLEEARLPADFVIDYVRVWQRRDLAPQGDLVSQAGGR